MGDFNVDLFKSEFCDFASQFIEQLFTSSFFPLFTKATRITSHSETLIDNIFTNNLEKLNDSEMVLFLAIFQTIYLLFICLTQIYLVKAESQMRLQ